MVSSPGIDPGATLVGGGCSHHYANSVPPNLYHYYHGDYWKFVMIVVVYFFASALNVVENEAKGVNEENLGPGVHEDLKVREESR